MLWIYFFGFKKPTQIFVCINVIMRMRWVANSGKLLGFQMVGIGKLLRLIGVGSIETLFLNTKAIFGNHHQNNFILYLSINSINQLDLQVDCRF